MSSGPVTRITTTEGVGDTGGRGEVKDERKEGRKEGRKRGRYRHVELE
jgi:hypothetical protein